MQLKRDTDYAIRVLFCLKDTIVSEGGKRQISFTLSEIASNIGLMRPTTRRICDLLTERGLIRRSDTGAAGEIAYYAERSMLRHSLLDVIEAVESTGNILAVFDRKTHMYRNCKTELGRVRKRCERILSSALLEDVIGKKK